MNYSLCVSHPSLTTLIIDTLQNNHEWGGRPWDPVAFEASRKYNPAYTVAKWSTPQLTIHGSKDYRLPESEGIAVFHALQQCVFFFLFRSILHTSFSCTYLFLIHRYSSFPSVFTPGG
jgi:hypothetical protein